jgi:hypothetical protein
VYPATNPVTFRARLCRQCKARCAVNGPPFTSSATPQWRHRRAPFGRARKRPSAALCLLERTGPFPARHALRLTASWLAERYRIGDGVHYGFLRDGGCRGAFAVAHGGFPSLDFPPPFYCGASRARADWLSLGRRPRRRIGYACAFLGRESQPSRTLDTPRYERWREIQASLPR